MPYGLRGADEATLEIFGGKVRVKDGGLDAGKLAAAATQTINADGFTLQHNNAAVLDLTHTGIFATHVSDATTAIADGVRVGQVLLIRLVWASIAGNVQIQNGANTSLQGYWLSRIDYAPGSWLKVVWDGSNWCEVGRHKGTSRTIAGENASAEGTYTTASGESAHAEGQSCTASGDNSHARNNSCTASGDRSSAEGEYAVADQVNEHAHGGGKFSSAGDAQYRRFVLRETTVHSDANWKTIGLNDSGVGPVIPANTLWSYHADVVGCDAGGAKVFHYSIAGAVKNFGGIVGVHSTTTVHHEDDADFDCMGQVSVGSTALAILVKDATSGGDTVHWVGTVHITQVTFPA